MVGTEEEGMVGRDIHLTLNVHRQLVSTEFNTINTVTYSCTNLIPGTDISPLIQ